MVDWPFAAMSETADALVHVFEPYVAVIAVTLTLAPAEFLRTTSAPVELTCHPPLGTPNPANPVAAACVHVEGLNTPNAHSAAATMITIRIAHPYVIRYSIAACPFFFMGIDRLLSQPA